MHPSNYTPRLFISIGLTHAFYTLRETYLHAVPGDGPMGNAVVNGVYQGSFEERSFHHFNLSQDADEAFEKATRYADEMGLRLTSTRDGIESEMRQITRATADEMERRRAEQQARELKWAAERAAEDERRREEIMAGRFGFGKFEGMAFPEAPIGYLNWLMDKTDEFEPGSLMRLTAEQVARRCADYRLPVPLREAVTGDPGRRMTFRVTVTRCIPVSGSDPFGRPKITYFTTMVTEDRICLLCKSSSLTADVGDRLTIKATIKEHDEYRGQVQTVVQRVAIVEEKQ